MPNTNKKITIDSETGGRDKTQLDGCYFQQQESPATAYDFFSKTNVSLYTGITAGTAFTFSFPEQNYSWTITPTTIVANTSASGSWTNTDTSPDATEPESGTFTAQATDPVEEDASSSAHA